MNLRIVPFVHKFIADFISLSICAHCYFTIQAISVLYLFTAALFVTDEQKIEFDCKCEVKVKKTKSRWHFH